MKLIFDKYDCFLPIKIKYQESLLFQTENNKVKRIYMSKKYIFYDLETTGRGKKESPNSFGTTPKWEQILQIAAIVVDEKFQETNQNLNEFCRPRISVIPQPGALLVTKRSIKDALAAKMSSYELITKIN